MQKRGCVYAPCSLRTLNARKTLTTATRNVLGKPPWATKATKHGAPTRQTSGQRRREVDTGSGILVSRKPEKKTCTQVHTCLTQLMHGISGTVPCLKDLKGKKYEHLTWTLAGFIPYIIIRPSDHPTSPHVTSTAPTASGEVIPHCSPVQPAKERRSPWTRDARTDHLKHVS